VLCCVTGVSGSGKSTLVHQILFKHLAKLKGVDFDGDPGQVRSIRGAEKIGSVVLVDQTPLSKTPRSSPALYIGIFDDIPPGVID
jgi:excinuclease ABC subunit A